MENWIKPLELEVIRLDALKRIKWEVATRIVRSLYEMAFEKGWKPAGGNNISAAIATCHRHLMQPTKEDFFVELNCSVFARGGIQSQKVVRLCKWKDITWDIYLQFNDEMSEQNTFFVENGQDFRDAYEAHIDRQMEQSGEQAAALIEKSRKAAI